MALFFGSGTVSPCAVGDHQEYGFVGRCSAISQFGQGIFCIAVMLVLHFHITRGGRRLWTWQDSHGLRPTCGEVHKDDGFYCQVLELW